MSTNRREGVSPLFVGLAVITLALSSWGLYRLFTDYANMPGLLAVLAVGGLDVVAVLCGKHALTLSEDGDSPTPWNMALLLFTALSAYAQFEHARLAGDALVIGITMAAFPVATVLLFEGQLRRAARIAGRRAGRLAQPRATFEPLIWLLNFRLAMAATRLAVFDRGLDSDSALTLGEALLRKQALERENRPQRRQLRRSYAGLLADNEVIDAESVRLDVPDNGATRADVPVHLPDVRAEEPDNDEDVPDIGAQRGEIARAVRAAAGRHGDVLADVLADVRDIFPDVSEDTVRKTLARQARRTG